MEYAELNNGIKMPTIGIGVFTFTPAEMAEIAKLDKNQRYYTRTDEALESYASMKPEYEKE